MLHKLRRPYHDLAIASGNSALMENLPPGSDPIVACDRSEDPHNATDVDSHVSCPKCQKLIMRRYKEIYPFGCHWTPWDSVPITTHVCSSQNAFHPGPLHTGKILQVVTVRFTSAEGFWVVTLDHPWESPEGTSLNYLSFPAPALEPILYP